MLSPSAALARVMESAGSEAGFVGTRGIIVSHTCMEDVGTSTVAVGVSAALVLTAAHPPAWIAMCQCPRPQSTEMRNEWPEFKTQANSRAAAVTFTESEVTSHGAEFVRASSIPLDSLQVYLCPEGFAEATCTFLGAGPDIDLLARESHDVTGARPRIILDDVLPGNIPGIAAVGL